MSDGTVTGADGPAAAASQLLADRGADPRLGDGAERLARLDGAINGLWPEGAPDDEVELLAPVLGEAAAEALAALLGGRVVRDPYDGDVAVEAGTVRLRVTARTRRLMRGGRGAPGLLALLARGRAATEDDPRGRQPAPHGPALGAARPLGLRRSAFTDPSPTDPEPIETVIPFRPVAQEAGVSEPQDVGRGPSLFVIFMFACVVATVVWAVYLYRNAPP